MKLKTSIIILAGCFGIFLFIMLPIVLSIQDKKEDYVASIKGSEFSLNDVNNNLITEKSFQGPSYSFIFWIYSLPRCMSYDFKQIKHYFRKIKKENKSLKVFFISIDPERDTPEVMKDYLNSFEGKFTGITGKPEKIFKLSQSWGIASQKIFSENGEYTVNHSSPIILLKNGKYVDRITHKDDLKRSIKIIKKYL